MTPSINIYQPSGGHHSGHHKHHKSQYNLVRQREPITRARLAMDVFEELVKIWVSAALYE